MRKNIGKHARREQLQKGFWRTVGYDLKMTKRQILHVNVPHPQVMGVTASCKAREADRRMHWESEGLVMRMVHGMP